MKDDNTVVLYNHSSDIKKEILFRQFAKDPLPPWAVNVRVEKNEDVKENNPKVYLCYECFTNDVEEWYNVVKVLKDETEALDWSEEVKPTDYTWRQVVEFEVE